MVHVYLLGSCLMETQGNQSLGKSEFFFPPENENNKQKSEDGPSHQTVYKCTITRKKMCLDSRIESFTMILEYGKKVY